MSVNKELAPNRNKAGFSQRSPSSSFIRIIQSSACLAARIPPAGLKPIAAAVRISYSRIMRAMTTPTGSTALTGSLPVDVLMKSAPAIIATMLARATLVSVASMVAMMAGADFIKTSTGKEPVNAVLPVGVVMTRMIREYEMRTGSAIGFKPAGGIRAAKQALDWLILMKEELGDRWLKPELFRLGASSLLTDIERQLEHFVTGRYAAAHRHPMV